MDPQTIDALNGLLENERASVDALVGLVSMATDSIERQALMVMGGQAAQTCHDLHERLEQSGAIVERRIGGGASHILGQDRFDDRLRAFGRHQQALADRIEALVATDLDTDTLALLASLRSMHLAHTVWSLQRAEEFTASREMANDQMEQARSGFVALPRWGERMDPTPVRERADVVELPPVAEPTALPDAAESDSRSAPKTRRPRARWPEEGDNQANGDHS